MTSSFSIHGKGRWQWLLILVALMGGYFASDIYHWLSTARHQHTSIDLSEYCALTTSSCQLGTVSIHADKDTSQPLLPTTVTVAWPNNDAQSLVLSLQGVEMEMGSPKFLLARTGDGQYQGELLLPVCTTDAMTWYGTVSDGHTHHKLSVRMER